MIKKELKWLSLIIIPVIALAIMTQYNMIPKTQASNQEKPIMNIGLANIGTGNVNTVNHITTSVITAKHQNGMVLATLSNGKNVILNDTNNQVNNGTIINLTVNEANPICIPVTTYPNGTITNLIDTISSNNYIFKHISFSQACDQHMPIQTISSWQIAKP